MEQSPGPVRAGASRTQGTTSQMQGATSQNVEPSLRRTEPPAVLQKALQVKATGHGHQSRDLKQQLWAGAGSGGGRRGLPPGILGSVCRGLWFSPRRWWVFLTPHGKGHVQGRATHEGQG